MAAVLGASRLVDCTQIIREGAFSFATSFFECPFKRQTIVDNRQEPAGFCKQRFDFPCDVGTHIDSPAHWFKGARAIHQLTLGELTAPGVVIDVTAKVEANADYLLTVADIEAWEQSHGPM
jgi:kynurenine formamidase